MQDIAMKGMPTFEGKYKLFLLVCYIILPCDRPMLFMTSAAALPSAVSCGFELCLSTEGSYNKTVCEQLLTP